MSTVFELKSQLESIWANLDALLADLDPTDWDRRHGRDWTFRDIPFHLSYFDDEMISLPLRRGAVVSADEQQILATISDLNAWNDAHMTERPLDTSPDQLLGEMRASRQRIREIIAGLEDNNLGDPVFLRLPGSGWSDVESTIRLAQVHVWNHFVEAKLRLGRSHPRADPAVTHSALQSLVSSMPIALNRAAAAQPFAAQICIDGPGGGTWTIDVRGGDCTVEQGTGGGADLTMRYRDAEVFAAAAFKVTHPIRLMLNGRLKVKGMTSMGRFAKLFPASPSD